MLKIYLSSGRLNAPITNQLSLALSPGGRTLAFGQRDGRIRVWSTLDRKFLANFQAHAGDVVVCRYSVDGRILATVGKDQTVRLWDMASTKIIHEYTAPHYLANALEFSPDGRTLAFAYLNEKDARGFVRLWNLGGRGEIAAFSAHSEATEVLAFTADGQTLAIGSTDSTAKLWDINNVTQPTAVLRGRLLSVNSLDFSPDDRRLAVSGGSGETKIWDVLSGQEVATLKGGDGFIGNTFFVDDGTLLTAGLKSDSYTFEIFRWRAPSLVEIDTAEKDETRLTRPKQAP